MKKIAATKDLQDEPPSHAEEVLSNAQVITWSCVLTWEASFITLGNLFTIITFTFIKKLRPKKSLYLVINMAFADLLLGSVSTYIYFYPCNLRTVIAGKISRFSQNDYCCFRAGLFYFCCFDIFWEILRHLLAAEAPNTFCASVQACYFGAVDFEYPWFYFYSFSPSLCKRSGFIFWTMFVRLVYCSDHLRPEHRYLEKISTKNCSTFAKQSLAKPALNKGIDVCFCYGFEFLAAFSRLQLGRLFWIQNVWQHFPCIFFYVFFQLLYQSCRIRITNSRV